MELITQPVQKALSKTGIPLGNYVFNPFRGCLIGCKYCYVQCNRGIKKINKDWGEYLYIKENIIEVLKKELDILNDIRRILIGSTTEAFQPIDRYKQITPVAIELMKSKNIPFVILTKQPDVSEYAELITSLPENMVYITINSEIVRKLFEKRSSPIEERLFAIEKCSKYNVKTIAYIGPFFPFLTDLEELLKKLHKKTKMIYIEAYHPNMGNFEEIKKLLSGNTDTLKVLENERNYYEYWNKTKEDIKKLNSKYEYEIKFFIPNYSKYY
ncbi:MAG: SPL family radical SAM protein [Brevinematia bacterium]